MNVYPLRVDGKIIIVTGGYGYLGKAMVESLLFHGATVIVAGRDDNKFENGFNNERCHFIQLDILRTDSIKTAFAKIKSNWNQIDVVVNNAFSSSGQSPEFMTDEEWQSGIDGTLSSTFRSIREIIPVFKAQGFGKIINIASMYGMVAPNFQVYEDHPEHLNPPHYGAAKAGVLQLTRYYASYLGKWNIQVNAITPGAFPGPEVQKDESFIKKLGNNSCLGRIGSPEEVAGGVVFLSSDAANFITGQNIVIDGGWTSK